MACLRLIDVHEATRDLRRKCDAAIDRVGRVFEGVGIKDEPEWGQRGS